MEKELFSECRTPGEAVGTVEHRDESGVGADSAYPE
jgi:hypothetical protein